MAKTAVTARAADAKRSAREALHRTPQTLRSGWKREPQAKAGDVPLAVDRSLAQWEWGAAMEVVCGLVGRRRVAVLIG